LAGIATRAGLAFVAGAGGVVEISAAGPLQQIAADGRGIAQLSRRSGQQRLGDRGIGLGEIRIVREIGVANQRADADAAIGQRFDAVEAGQARDVDQTFRTADAALHQVEQVGAGGEIGRIRGGRGGDGVGDGRRPDIFEVVHAERLWLAVARVCWASSTASVIPA
jgi:hypothetical protein